MERRTHFTLVELLIVIAIIAVLAAILLPALAHSKSLAYRLQCASRIRQLNCAVLLYCNDNNENLPPLVSAPPSKLLVNTYLLPYLGNLENLERNVLKFCCPTAYQLNPNADRHVANGDIFPYYSAGTGNWLDLELQPIKISKINESSKTFTFYCLSAISNTGTLYATYINRLKAGHLYCNVGLVHNGVVNIGFIDGHVVSEPGQAGKTFDVANQTSAGGGSSSSLSTLWR